MPSLGVAGKSLDKIIYSLIESIIHDSHLEGTGILVSQNLFFERQTGISPLFSNVLRDKVVSNLKKLGVDVLSPGSSSNDEYSFKGTWHEEGKDLVLTFEVLRISRYGVSVHASATQKISIRAIDPKLLKKDGRSLSRYLVKTLDDNWTRKGMSGSGKKQLHIRPLVVSEKDASPDLGRYMADLLRPSVAESQVFTLIDPAKELTKISSPTIRKRSTQEFRAIRPELQKNPSMSLIGGMVGADVELVGSIYMFSDHLQVQSHITGKEGKQLSAASVDFPKDVIPPRLLIPIKIEQPVVVIASEPKTPNDAKVVSGGILYSGTISTFLND